MKQTAVSDVEFRRATITVLSEIESILNGVRYEDIHPLLCAISKARRVFLSGAGRSRQMLSAFAMRLMHLGFSVYMVGDVITPAIEADDLLIVASGSGETSTVVAVAQKAYKVGAKIALLTTRRSSTLQRVAEIVIVLAASRGRQGVIEAIKSMQVGASAFEQATLLLCDTMILLLAQTQGIDTANKLLQERHANLE